MAIEEKRGIVEGLTPQEKGGAAQCQVAGQAVLIHADLLRHVTAGDEVVVAGPQDEKGLAALAMRNLSQDRRLTYVDMSNIVLALGFTGFISISFFILSAQNLMVGNDSTGTILVIVALAGLAGLGWCVNKLLALRKASRLVKWFDESLS